MYLHDRGIFYCDRYSVKNKDRHYTTIKIMNENIYFYSFYNYSSINIFGSPALGTNVRQNTCIPFIKIDDCVQDAIEVIQKKYKTMANFQ